jgi:hypothetical protein
MVQPENIDSGHSNFQLDTRSGGHYCNLDYLLVYLALGRQNHERGRRLRWLADSCSAANDVHRLQRFTRYWSLVARASRRIRTYPRHDPWEFACAAAAGDVAETPFRDISSATRFPMR